ncbi:DUF6049 family protein [Amycolatopsis sp. PS_44_ISF1]|uniref:DUF6049 family protein n=1 Tax=Amycolatopsis sp. PS_44_ISF1 TaxID=2974917 RepID=UPI0028E07413|nr:DUF6049 family protein [Amycolatopsis sp. PS_44_ISF1]MDT8910463.1 DUF6049 family protein [Amycolatopsis sp. PS_44_ISF1]
MKRPAAFFLSLLFFAVAALFGAPAWAQDEPNPEPPRLRIDLTQLSPRVVTGDSDLLTVSGTVRNIGDRRITRPQARLQVGERLTSDRAVTGVLSGEQAQDTPLTDFSTLTEALEPGQSARFDIRVPLNGRTLSKPGVYPMLVNVNGTPEFGGAARLAAVSLLMPVLSAPGGKANPPAAKRANVSVLWPITDSTPHVLSSPYGGQLTLSDDTLEKELKPDGRLYSLVSAARAAQENNPRVRDSLCFAIDPDLLQTVDAMTRGYVVGGAPGPGGGAAKDWLSSLQALVKGRCVVTMPFADADLTTLGKVHSATGADPDLLQSALGGAATIQRLLGVRPQEGVLWPDGTPDSQALIAMAGAGFTTVLTDGSKLQAKAPISGAVTLSPSGQRAQPIDGLIAAAMTGAPPNPQFPTTVGAASQPAISGQNGLAAIAFEAGLGRTDTKPNARLLVAPPRRWTAPTSELTTFLDQLGAYFADGLATGAPLTAQLQADATGTASLSAGSRDQPASTGDPEALSTLDTQASGLLSAMRVDTTARVQPEAIVAPVRDAIVRGASTAWQSAAPDAAVANANAELGAIRNQVTVEQPKQTIALASGSSPLPVYVRNDLPVGITAQIALKNNIGIRPLAPQQTPFPAHAGQNKYLQIEALRAGLLSVDVSLTTPTGTSLGTPARFELTSTEYGPITIIFTVVAGAALLLLASRRIYRRIKESRKAG